MKQEGRFDGTRNLEKKMYVTRPLSLYKRIPSALLSLPPEGPNSGILVIQDEEAEPASCFGLCKSYELRELPFPQNMKLETCLPMGDSTFYNDVVFIPVLNHPLSSNRYYAIQPRGKHTGEAFTSSSEEDMITCCFCNSVSGRKPQPFDPNNIYQQIEICCLESFGTHFFYAKSVTPDGFPPEFLRSRGWSVVTKTPKNFELGEAPGLDTNLRARLPDFNFPLSYHSSKPVVVGKWYCPFIFIKEKTLKRQVRDTMYYEMTLEQRWEQIFACGNNYKKDKATAVDVDIHTQVFSFAGIEIVPDEKNVVDGMMWFRSSGNEEGQVSVGLSTLIIERMKWEQERFGWVREHEGQVSVKRVEEFTGVGERSKFGCYMLVERFVLKRMDGSLVLTYDFKHTHRIRSKWE